MKLSPQNSYGHRCQIIRPSEVHTFFPSCTNIFDVQFQQLLSTISEYTTVPIWNPTAQFVSRTIAPSTQNHANRIWRTYFATSVICTCSNTENYIYTASSLSNKRNHLTRAASSLPVYSMSPSKHCLM
jgi:hypothetical protein